MEEKIHHIMFCYIWHGGQHKGDGHKILQNKTKELTLKDINEAADFIKSDVCSKFEYAESKIQVVMTNIIHLNYCSANEFYGTENK